MAAKSFLFLHIENLKTCLKTPKMLKNGGLHGTKFEITNAKLHNAYVCFHVPDTMYTECRLVLGRVGPAACLSSRT